MSGIEIHHFCEIRGFFDHEKQMNRIYRQVRDSAYEIIERKGATYYGVAMAVGRICESIIRDEHAVLPVSGLLCGEYGLKDLCISVPSIVGGRGLEQVLEIPLNEKEQAELERSARQIRQVLREAGMT